MVTWLSSLRIFHICGFISTIEEANNSYYEENILNFLLLMGGEERNKIQKNNVLEMAEKTTSVFLMQWDKGNLPFEIWINTIRKWY